MVIIIFLLAPLQTAFMAPGPAVCQDSLNITTRSRLAPLPRQIELLDTDILAYAYTVSWFGRPYPAFTTPDYALLPFYIEPDVDSRRKPANLTARTTKLWAELTCWPADVTPAFPRRIFNYLAGLNETYYEFNISNGQGCVTQFPAVVGAETPYGIRYAGYTAFIRNPGYTPYQISVTSGVPSLSESRCGNETIHQSALAWVKLVHKNETSFRLGESSAIDLQITGRFCRSHYYKQEVLVTVGAGDSRPHESSLQPISERLPLGDDDFNATAFEILVNDNDVRRSVRGYNGGFEPFGQTTRRPFPAMEWSYGGGFDMINSVFAGKNLSIAELSDPKRLEMEFDKSLKYLFTLSVYHTLVNYTNFADSNASATFPLRGIIVSGPFSALIGGILIFNALISLALLYLCRTSSCYLRFNPNSILRTSYICNNRHTIQLFLEFDNADEKELRLALGDGVFRLARRRRLKNELYLERISSPETKEPICSSSKGQHEPDSENRDIRPFEMTRRAGVILFLVLAGATATITWLKIEEFKQGGLPRPSETLEVLRILENYIPSNFATILKAFWNLLNKDLCVLQPLKDLYTGRALPSRSIATTYSAIPSSLAFWRAVKARHHLLTLLCSTSLVANLLGIGLGTLFHEDDVVARYSHRFEPLISPIFHSQSLLDYRHEYTGASSHEMYYVLSTMTSNTALPPWSSKDWFFLPHRVVPGAGTSPDTTYTLNTRGFGVHANCTAMSSLPVPHLWSSWGCTSATQKAAELLYMSNYPSRRGKSLEISASSIIETFKGRPCPPFDFIVGWVRAFLDNTTRSNNTALYCRPFFQTAMFDVIIDERGKVHSYRQTSKDIESSLNYPTFDRDSQAVFLYAMEYNDRVPQSAQWHTGILLRDWMTTLIAALKGSRGFIDPASPPPDPFEMMPAVEAVYRRGFSFLLGRHWQQFFEPGRANDSITGLRLTHETRIFLDKKAFVISIAVLSANMIITIVFYTRPAIRIPRLPTSIASTIAYVAPSRLGAMWNDEDLEKRTFSYGRYIGLDGKPHTGIEMDPHVTLVKPSSDDGKTWNVKGIFRRRKLAARSSDGGPK
ncbi:hypothetical protein CDD83_5356 [Cordyceps sp. RAO-2017]|nr:hypothetical protein CDD83_5356 [Cordyceps sp. RAO-2017]